MMYLPVSYLLRSLTHQEASGDQVLLPLVGTLPLVDRPSLQSYVYKQ